MSAEGNLKVNGGHRVEVMYGGAGRPNDVARTPTGRLHPRPERTRLSPRMFRKTQRPFNSDQSGADDTGCTGRGEISVRRALRNRLGCIEMKAGGGDPIFNSFECKGSSRRLDGDVQPRSKQVQRKSSCHNYHWLPLGHQRTSTVRIIEHVSQSDCRRGPNGPNRLVVRVGIHQN